MKLDRCSGWKESQYRRLEAVAGEEARRNAVAISCIPRTFASARTTVLLERELDFLAREEDLTRETRANVRFRACGTHSEDKKHREEGR